MWIIYVLKISSLTCVLPHRNTRPLSEDLCPTDYLPQTRPKKDDVPIRSPIKICYEKSGFIVNAE